jgi:hypothetical protein
MKLPKQEHAVLRFAPIKIGTIYTRNNQVVPNKTTNTLIDNGGLVPDGCCTQACVNTPLGQVCHCVVASPFC